MGIYVNPGNTAFQKALNSDIYIDKTDLIAITNDKIGKTDCFMCVSRPRRFGKSMAADMLAAYYGKGCDSRELFAGRKIEKEESFPTHLNRHNVIRLDIQRFLFDESHLDIFIDKIQEAVIRELETEYGGSFIKDQYGLPGVLGQIYAHTKKGFIFIIDEWDCVFRFAKERQEIQKAYLDFLRGLFKGAEYVELAYMTGILPIKRYDSQSVVSDFREYTMLAPRKLAKYTGFTEAETAWLCKEYGVDFSEMKRWYDGYSFSRIKSVYNPNSVIEAVKNEEFGSYWARTETYESLKIYIELNEDGLKEAVVQMLGGESIPIETETFQNDMTNIKRKDDVLTLLIHLGYLAYDAERKRVFIPNEEVKQEFIRTVTVGRHKELARLIQNSDLLLQQTLNMDHEAVAAAIEEAHKASAIPLTYNSEEALRSTIRFAYLTCVDEFMRIEELPSGHGYADMVFIPRKNSSMPVILVELRWDKTAESAIEQIKSRDYPQVLWEYGGEILLVGINYSEKSKKHSCKIEKYQK